MADWFIARSGQQQGPFSDDGLRQMIREGSLAAHDFVWREGALDWTPLKQIAEFNGLFPASSAFPVGYAQSLTSGALPMLTERSFDLLRQTRPWVRVIGVVMMSFAALFAVAAILLLIVGGLSGGTSGFGKREMIGIGLGYGLSGLFCFVPGLYLNRYANRITLLMRGRREDQLEQALQTQKSFWKSVCVLTLLMALALVVLFSIAIVDSMNARRATPSPSVYPSRP